MNKRNRLLFAYCIRILSNEQLDLRLTFFLLLWQKKQALTGMSIVSKSELLIWWQVVVSNINGT